MPLSNIDLRKWCDLLRIPIKGIYSRNEPKPLSHSPCIINLDDFGNLGNHWVCCWRSKNGTYEYFDSFGLPPPLEWEKEMSVHGIKHFSETTTKFNGNKVSDVVITAFCF